MNCSFSQTMPSNAVVKKAILFIISRMKGASGQPNSTNKAGSCSLEPASWFKIKHLLQIAIETATARGRRRRINCNAVLFVVSCCGRCCSLFNYDLSARRKQWEGNFHRKRRRRRGQIIIERERDSFCFLFCSWTFKLRNTCTT